MTAKAIHHAARNARMRKRLHKLREDCTLSADHPNLNDSLYLLADVLGIVEWAATNEHLGALSEIGRVLLDVHIRAAAQGGR